MADRLTVTFAPKDDWHYSGALVGRIRSVFLADGKSFLNFIQTRWRGGPQEQVSDLGAVLLARGGAIVSFEVLLVKDFESWSGRCDLNARPSEPHSDAQIRSGAVNRQGREVPSPDVSLENPAPFPVEHQHPTGYPGTIAYCKCPYAVVGSTAATQPGGVANVEGAIDGSD